MDATPEARGAARAAEATVPTQANQAPNRPTAKRVSQPRGAEAAAGVAEGVKGAEAAVGSEADEASGGAESAARAERASRPQLAQPARELEGPEPSEDLVGEPGEPERHGMAPRQARRIRMVAAGVLMAAMGVILVVRLATRSSVLVVGVYGLALILCGVVIELSRNGRTRLGSWLLVVGLAAALGMDWFVLP